MACYLHGRIGGAQQAAAVDGQRPRHGVQHPVHRHVLHRRRRFPTPNNSVNFVYLNSSIVVDKKSSRTYAITVIDD